MQKSFSTNLTQRAGDGLAEAIRQRTQSQEDVLAQAYPTAPPAPLFAPPARVDATPTPSSSNVSSGARQFASVVPPVANDQENEAPVSFDFEQEKRRLSGSSSQPGMPLSKTPDATAGKSALLNADNLTKTVPVGKDSSKNQSVQFA